MNYVLAEGVSFCMVTERAVFLDLRNNRYSCLGPNTEAAFARLVSGYEIGKRDHEALDRLVRKNLLVPAPSGIPPQACRATETHIAPTNAEDEGDVPNYRRHVLPALYELAVAAVDLKLRSLWSVVQRIRLRKAAANGNADSHLEIATAFRWTELLVESHDRCLPRSVAITRHLLRHDHRPNLVFGVMLNPFGAHCWVEEGGLILNDRYENVRGFTPILVI